MSTGARGQTVRQRNGLQGAVHVERGEWAGARPHVQREEGDPRQLAVDDLACGVTVVNIRKFVVRTARLQDLVSIGTLTTQAAQFLDAAVLSGLNVIVAGGTQLEHLLGRDHPVPAGNARGEAVEQSRLSRLRFNHPDWVAMPTR